MKVCIRSIILFSFVLMLLDCTKESSTKTKLKIGLNPWPGYELVYLAKVKNFFEESELKIDVLEYSSLADVQLAYNRGHIDIMCVTLIEMLQTHESTSIKSKIIYIPDYSNGPDVILALNEISNIKGLKGKNVAVEMGSLGEFMIGRALQINNMKISDVKFHPMDQTKMLASIVKGKIDAVVTYPPISIKMYKTGKVKKIFSSADIPYEVVDAIVAKDSAFIAEPNLIKKFSKAYNMALNYSNKHKEESYKIMAKREGILAKEFEESLEGLVLLNQKNQDKMLKNGSILKAIEATNKVLVDTKSMKKIYNPKTFIK